MEESEHYSDEKSSDQESEEGSEELEPYSEKKLTAEVEAGILRR